VFSLYELSKVSSASFSRAVCEHKVFCSESSTSVQVLRSGICVRLLRWLGQPLDMVHVSGKGENSILSVENRS
jgi:hypothetical protein